METVTLAGQTWSFLFSCLFGAALGALYTAFRLVRVLFGGRKGITLFCDLLFAVLAAAVSFLLFLRLSDGQIRFYILLGEGLGFLAFYCSLGALLARVGTFLIRKISGAFRAAFAPFRRFAERQRVKREARVEIRQKKSVKSEKNPENPLQSKEKRVYTLKGLYCKIRKKEGIVREGRKST